MYFCERTCQYRANIIGNLMYSSQLIRFPIYDDERATRVPEHGRHGVPFLYGYSDILG